MTIGRYEIQRELGRGGMGAVLLGWDPMLARKVAIKTVVFQGLEKDEQALMMKGFLREARVVASLRHPGIVSIHDILQIGTSTYIVMEFVHGKTLADAFPLSRTVPPAEVLRIVRECAAALDYAHGRGIVHRDIKPDNIMLDENDGNAVRIADFGIAKIVGGESLYSGIAVGTFDYMSPEQAGADPNVDGRSDQFSLAAMAHRMLTGGKLYSARTIRSYLVQIAILPPPSACKLNPALPAAVDVVLAKALRKDRNGRYSTCLEFAEALAAAFAPVVPVRKKGDKLVNPVDGMTYVWIPAGTFMMGCSPGDKECEDDEKPARQVTIERGFWLGRTPVTQAAYQRVMGNNPSDFRGADLPVECVTWDEARKYCERVGGRLPTEAEWEYAARGETTGARYGELKDIAWYGENSEGKTHPVGWKQANAYGLYDMLGNVWEWVEDLYPGTQDRSLRGGSWSDVPRYTRASNRIRGLPGGRDSGVGFRCAWDNP